MTKNKATAASNQMKSQVMSDTGASLGKSNVPDSLRRAMASMAAYDVKAQSAYNAASSAPLTEAGALLAEIDATHANTLFEQGAALPAGFGEVGLSDAANRQSITLRSSADLGHLVRQAREARKMSQQHFADLAGVGRRFLSELENGKETLEFAKVLKVANAAGLSLFARAW